MRHTRSALKDVQVEGVPRKSIAETPELAEKSTKLVRQRIVYAATPSLKDTFKGRLAWKTKHYSGPVTSTPVRSSRTRSAATHLVTESSSILDFDAQQEENDYSSCISPIRKVNRVQDRHEVVIIKKLPPPPSSPVPLEPAPDPKDLNQAPIISDSTPEHPAADTEDTNPPAKDSTPTSKKLEQQEVKPARFEDLVHKYCDDEDEELHVNVDAIKFTYGKSKTRAPRGLQAYKNQKGPILRKRKALKAPIKEPVKHRKEHVNKDLEKWIEQTTKEFEDVAKTPLVVEKSMD